MPHATVRSRAIALDPPPKSGRLRGPREKWHAVDVAIAMQNMILAATALGYGTCWIGAFDQGRVKEVLGVPEDVTVIALTPVGTPADQPGGRPRMPMSEFVSLDRYGR